MLIAGAEFLAMILVIVYVGAVAVLFLFVVMMLDIDFVRLRQGFQRYAPVGGAVGAVLFVELIFVLGAWRFASDAADLRINPTPGGSVSNTAAIGRILYTDYLLLFQLSGLVLLVAMMGAIVLTHRTRPGTRRQNIDAQVSRTGSVGLVHVPQGAGLREMGILRPPELDAPKPIAAPGVHGGHH
jgi:NADH-quinone oxidoreductase subunit J